MEEPGVSPGSRSLTGREGATLGVADALRWERSLSFRGTSGKGDVEALGVGWLQEKLSGRDSLEPGLRTPSLVLISILWCLHFPGRAEEFWRAGSPQLVKFGGRLSFKRQPHRWWRSQQGPLGTAGRAV